MRHHHRSIREQGAWLQRVLRGYYVDNVLFAEAERGYLPFNWRWELNRLPPGEHLLTVNVSSFSGQVGVSSRKVRVTSSAAD